MKNTFFKACMLGCLMLPALQVTAETANGSRLDRLKETGIMVAGYRETAVPFSYLHNDKPTGFSVEITERIVQALRVKLDRPDLKIRWNAVTLSTRMPMMMTKTLDVLCASDTVTAERQELVDFSPSFIVSEFGVAVPPDSSIKSMDDLRGKRLAVPVNSTAEQYVSELNAKGAGISVVSRRTSADGVREVKQGHVDGFINNDVVVAGTILRMGMTSAYALVRGGAKEEFACMLPNNDQAFREAVEEVMLPMMKSGEMEALYNKWFTKPIPGYEGGMNMPINDATRELYKKQSGG